MFDVNDKLTSSQNTEEDALQVFRRAVNNGQTRLALEALVDVIDAIVEILTPEEEEQVEEPKNIEPQQIKPSVEIKEEVPATTSKKKAKEATASDSAE